MNDIFVPDDEQFELAKDFFNGAVKLLMNSRIFVAWMAAGMAAGALEAAMAYC